MNGFEVLIPGAQTAIQDSGYEGYLGEGICASGAMDFHSLSLANLLVGNPAEEAGLEITATGPSLKFLTDEIIAVTGAEIPPMIDGVPIPRYCAIRVKQGQILSFGMRKRGFRAYIAFAGGLDVPFFLGSKSTIIRSKLGGFHGRKLEKGDVVDFTCPKADMPNLLARALKTEPMEETDVVLRVIPGPQDYMFSPESLHTLESAEGYTVSEKNNRQGYRLNGPVINPLNTVNIVSDGIAKGAIQISPKGEPFILLSESSPVGGYAKIGNIISVDLPKIAQTFTGSKLFFRFITVEEAQQLLLQEHQRLLAIEDYLSHVSARTYRITFSGTKYDVSIAAVEM